MTTDTIEAIEVAEPASQQVSPAPPEAAFMAGYQLMIDLALAAEEHEFTSECDLEVRYRMGRPHVNVARPFIDRLIASPELAEGFSATLSACMASQGVGFASSTGGLTVDEIFGPWDGRDIDGNLVDGTDTQERPLAPIAPDVVEGEPGGEVLQSLKSANDAAIDVGHLLDQAELRLAAVGGDGALRALLQAASAKVSQCIGGIRRAELEVADLVSNGLPDTSSPAPDPALAATNAPDHLIYAGELLRMAWDRTQASRDDPTMEALLHSLRGVLDEINGDVVGQLEATPS